MSCTYSFLTLFFYNSINTFKNLYSPKIQSVTRSITRNGYQSIQKLAKLFIFYFKSLLSCSFFILFKSLLSCSFFILAMQKDCEAAAKRSVTFSNFSKKYDSFYNNILYSMLTIFFLHC